MCGRSAAAGAPRSRNTPAVAGPKELPQQANVSAKTVGEIGSRGSRHRHWSPVGAKDPRPSPHIGPVSARQVLDVSCIRNMTGVDPKKEKHFAQGLPPA